MNYIRFAIAFSPSRYSKRIEKDYSFSAPMPGRRNQSTVLVVYGRTVEESVFFGD
jgi:hypothetical protein